MTPSDIKAVLRGALETVAKAAGAGAAVYGASSSFKYAAVAAIAAASADVIVQLVPAGASVKLAEQSGSK